MNTHKYSCLSRLAKRVCLAIVVLPSLFLFGDGVSGDTLYVGCYGGGITSIRKYDTTTGNGCVFATNGVQVIAFGPDGNLYGSGGDSIYKFDSSGNKSFFGSAGTELTGLAFDSSGNLYAADWVNGGDIYKFDASGSSSIFLSNLPEPINVAVDTSGNVYVANWYGGIQKFNSTGRFLSSWGGDNAYGLAVDSSGNAYVSLVNRIVRIDASGNLTNYASNLEGIGGLACDSGGNLYVVYQGGSVQKFDADGNQSTFASGLSSPLGIAIAPGPFDYGCCIDQLVPCAGPATGGTWKSHGQYVAAVVHEATDFLKAGLISRRQWVQIVTQAARSKCGWNRRCDRDGDRDWGRPWDCDRDGDWGGDRR